jgi:hypothetical protein
MKITQNEAGQDVYRLESIIDIALMPDHMTDQAIEALPLMIYYTKMILAAAESEGTRSQIEASLPSYLEFVDDGKLAVYHQVGDRNIASIELKEEPCA